MKTVTKFYGNCCIITDENGRFCDLTTIKKVENKLKDKFKGESVKMEYVKKVSKKSPETLLVIKAQYNKTIHWFDKVRTIGEILNEFTIIKKEISVQAYKKSKVGFDLIKNPKLFYFIHINDGKDRILEVPREIFDDYQAETEITKRSALK